MHQSDESRGAATTDPAEKVGPADTSGPPPLPPAATKPGAPHPGGDRSERPRAADGVPQRAARDADPKGERQASVAGRDAPEPLALKMVRSSSSWLLSVVVHLAALLVLALWSLTEPPSSRPLLVAGPNDAIEELDEVPELAVDEIDLEQPVELEVQPETQVIAEVVNFAVADDATEAPSFSELSDLALTAAPPVQPTNLRGFDGAGTAGRGRAARTAMVSRHGGSKASEEAVARALKWLARHQNADGTWSLVHDRGECRGRCPNPANVGRNEAGFSRSLTSGTGLALLPFLGAGQTHKNGVHRKSVQRGLDALVALGRSQQGVPGASWADSGRMYAHGIAAIALTEAYGMTGDSRLRRPAQAAIDHIVYAQAADGGWRYDPKQPGDTSVTGWQIMALKSAQLSRLVVPTPTATAAGRYLDRAQHQSGATYAYTPGGRPKHQMSAVGLLCRMYLGWDREKAPLKLGVAEIAKRGPSVNDFYHNYYAAQVMFQHTGGRGVLWRDFNRELRDQLVAQQVKAGHAEGSWYLEGPHNKRGGRLYMTALAMMCLEVYYRYMPIYGTEAVEQNF